MSALETAYADGQLAALSHYKLAWPVPTHPAVRNSAVNTGVAGKPPAPLKAPATPIDPPSLAQNFSAREQDKTLGEPRRKLSADICSSCRKEKHYGNCKRPIAIKRSNFNPGMTGDDPSQASNLATSQRYTSATSGVSAAARAVDGRPAGEQARSAFADFLRPARDSAMTDESRQVTAALVLTKMRNAQALVAGEDADRAWRSFDGPSTSATGIEGSSTPSGGPVA